MGEGFGAAAGRPASSRKHRALRDIPEAAFGAQQLCLFQTFLANTDDQREALSNAIDFWDAVPRYSVSRARMESMRTKDGFLDVLELPFEYGQKQYTARIYPARIRTSDTAGGGLSYYPSAREELIEHALRKLACDQQSGFLDQSETSGRSGVRFSLYRLRRELEAQGHALRYDQLVSGLDILSLSTIEIDSRGGDGEELFARSAYLPGLVGVRRHEYDADREARWFAHFHPLVTQSIQCASFRQFNYRRLMSCHTQLARWLLCLLVLKYRQASPLQCFSVRFRTIRRDSGLLEGYARARDAVAKVDEAWSELEELGVLSAVDRIEQRGQRMKLEDVNYSVRATLGFAAEQKAANRRSSDCRQMPLAFIGDIGRGKREK